jgi:glycosyltransferase involved in cell wall biosynthesis
MAKNFRFNPPPKRSWDIRKDEPVVSVCVQTYQHANYIRDCLDGILMQATDFPFELLLHDDASTDGTVEICREYAEKYPEIIKPIFQKENKYSEGICPFTEYQIPRARGRYIAFCEGDDYWTDTQKLQKQVEILDANKDASACVHDFMYYDQAKDEHLGRRNAALTSEGGILKFDSFSFGNWIYQPLTGMIRRDLVAGIDSSPYKYWRDMHLYYILTQKGVVCYYNRCMGVYRQHEGGIHMSSNQYQKVRTDLFVWHELWLNFRSRDLEERFFKVLNQVIAIELGSGLKNYKDYITIFRKSCSISLAKSVSLPFRLFVRLIAS